MQPRVHHGLLYSYILGCPKKHKSGQMKLDMKILDPFDINMMPDFFVKFRGLLPCELWSSFYGNIGYFSSFP